MTNSTPQTNIHFGRFIATLREARGLTQEMLAQRAGMSVGTIYRGERDGDCALRRSSAMQIMATLDRARKLSEAEAAAFIEAADLSELAAFMPQSTGARREGGSGRSDRDLDHDALSRHVQVDLIRGAINQFKGMIASRVAARINADYERGAVSGLVMALEFIGEVTRDEAKKLREDISLSPVGGEA